MSTPREERPMTFGGKPFFTLSFGSSSLTGKWSGEKRKEGGKK